MNHRRGSRKQIFGQSPQIKTPKAPSGLGWGIGGMSHPEPARGSEVHGKLPQWYIRVEPRTEMHSGVF